MRPPARSTADPLHTLRDRISASRAEVRSVEAGLGPGSPTLDRGSVREWFADCCPAVIFAGIAARSLADKPGSILWIGRTCWPFLDIPRFCSIQAQDSRSGWIELWVGRSPTSDPTPQRCIHMLDRMPATTPWRDDSRSRLLKGPSMKAAIVMVLYAAALLCVGYLTYSLAPPGANAATALYISAGIGALMVLCAIATLARKVNRTVGMIGIHLGLVLPLLAAAGPIARLPGSMENAKRFNDAVAAQGVMVEPLTDENRDLPHPVAYQSVALGSTAALSLFAFGAILSHRSKTPKKDDAGE
jgi:hypothetical protein